MRQEPSLSPPELERPVPGRWRGSRPQQGGLPRLLPRPAAPPVRSQPLARGAEGSGASLCVSSLRAVSAPRVGSERLGSGPGGSLASPSPPGPAHIPTLKHPRVRVQFSGWTQVHGRHGERAGRAIGPRGPLFPPPPPQGRARSPHRGFRLEQGGFPNSARSRRTPAGHPVAPHSRGSALHAPREGGEGEAEGSRPRFCCRGGGPIGSRWPSCGGG